MNRTVVRVQAAVAFATLLSAPVAKATVVRPLALEAIGQAVSPVPCVPTSNPLATGFTGTESSTWVGTLTGQSVYTVATSYDLVTGDGSGTIDETWTGRSSDGRIGSIHFHETVTSTPTGLPDTGTLDIVATADTGTGGFEGVRGGLEFFGIVNGACSSSGYHGMLRFPGR